MVLLVAAAAASSIVLLAVVALPAMSFEMLSRQANPENVTKLI